MPLDWFSLFLSSWPFLFEVFSCHPHLPVSLAPFVSPMNTAPGPSRAGVKKASSFVRSYSRDLFSQTLTSVDWTLRCKRHQNLAPHYLEAWTTISPSQSYCNSQNNAHPDSDLYTASSASRQTLHNVKTNWQPKSSSFVSRSIYTAMCKLWCPQEAENSTESWDVVGKTGLAISAAHEGFSHTKPLAAACLEERS